MLSQKSLRARSHRDKTSSPSVMASRKYSPRTNRIRSLLFQSLVTEATEEVKDPRTSSVKVSGSSRSSPKNSRETSEDPQSSEPKIRLTKSNNTVIMKSNQNEEINLKRAI